MSTDSMTPEGAEADLATDAKELQRFLKTKATTAAYTRITLRTETVEKAADAIADLVAENERLQRDLAEERAKHALTFQHVQSDTGHRRQ